MYTHTVSLPAFFMWRKYACKSLNGSIYTGRWIVIVHINIPWLTWGFRKAWNKYSTWKVILFSQRHCHNDALQWNQMGKKWTPTAIPVRGKPSNGIKKNRKEGRNLRRNFRNFILKTTGHGILPGWQNFCEPLLIDVYDIIWKVVGT